MYDDNYDENGYDDDYDDNDREEAKTLSLVQPLPLYYAGFEFGSATSSLLISSPNHFEATPTLATLPSFLADGDLATLFTNSASSSMLEKVLRPNEYVLTYYNHTYFLGDLLEQGTHLDTAFGDESRYWSDHAQVLLLCLACMLIPERRFALRIVTALPVSLADPARRGYLRRAFSRHHRFLFNGSTREVEVSCGYIALEGQGILIHFGDQSSSQAVIDIGERTTDLIAAKGQRLTGRLCRGQLLGVGELVEDLQQLAHAHHRTLSVEQAQAILKAYTLHEPYCMIRTASGDPTDTIITRTIKHSIQRLARPLSTFLARTWNVEGIPPGSQFETIYLGGGGAYYFEDVIWESLPGSRVVTIANPHLANLAGYLTLATSLPEAHWKHDPWPERFVIYYQ